MKSPRETRIFGLNACLAVFQHRAQAIRKVYLTHARQEALQPVLRWCAQQRIGYRWVEREDLKKLTQTEHHEGVCFEVLQKAPQSLPEFLAARPPHTQPLALALWLAGVGNPHNLGAVLRSAAHFGADAVLVARDSGLGLSGSVCRVAEGAAEQVPIVALDDAGQSLQALRQAGFQVLATHVREGSSLFAYPVPGRVVFVLGAEHAGIPDALLRALPERIQIPGTGAVESLNVATAAGIIMAEHYRRHRVPML